MISYYQKEDWDRFGKKCSENTEHIIIDIRKCQSRNNIVLLIGTTLRASYSAEMQTGKSLDALHDVVSDWFIEHWNNWKTVYIIGWQNFTEKYPFFSQDVLQVLNDAYLTCITGQMREVVQWKTIGCEKINFLTAMYENPPKIFLVCN